MFFFIVLVISLQMIWSITVMLGCLLGIMVLVLAQVVEVEAAVIVMVVNVIFAMMGCAVLNTI